MLNSQPFFTQYGRILNAQTTPKTTHYPFKDQAQLAAIVDIFLRKEKHHLQLQTPLSECAKLNFLTSLNQHLLNEKIPSYLQNAEIIYIDFNTIFLNRTQQTQIEKDFQDCLQELTTRDNHLIFALDNMNFLQPNNVTERLLRPLFHAFLTHPKCRFILLENKLNKQPIPLFESLILNSLTDQDLLLILKKERESLEQFHHVLIPEECLTLSYSLAKRYLHEQHALDKAILLLDSAAARTYALEEAEHGAPHTKPVLTQSLLLQTLSHLVHIPATHLQFNKSKLHDFIKTVEQDFFGQEAALQLLMQRLQQSFAQIHLSSAPFCSLLFAGPKNSGKTTLATLLAEHLFKQSHAFYRAIYHHATDLATMTLRGNEVAHYQPLTEIIENKPFAVILFEDIENAAHLFADLQQVLETGCLHDKNGKVFYFQQSIFIFTTSINVENSPDYQLSEESNLVDLIMNNAFESAPASMKGTAQELAHHLISDIGHTLPDFLYQTTTLIPFLPLSLSTLEHIARTKLKTLCHTVALRFGIELNYAPEVIRFLATNARAKIDKFTTLHSTVEQAILSQTDNKNRPTQLFLQLNETGQALRYDWIHLATLKVHAS